jgi:hypothetical protein
VFPLPFLTNYLARHDSQYFSKMFVHKSCSYLYSVFQFRMFRHASLEDYANFILQFASMFLSVIIDVLLLLVLCSKI